MGRVVVAGAGVGGLGAALYLGRSGHDVTLVERDDTPLPETATEAFWWDRRGAPQVRHSHAFLARLRNQLRSDHPDVLERLLEVGATEMDFIAMLPEGMDRTPMEGDDELVAIACRRTTFEWVLRRTVLDEGTVTLRHGEAVDALLTDERQAGSGNGAQDPAPHVRGVRLESGIELEADAVVLAGGRRMDVPALYAAAGVELAESEQDTGIIYLSRYYRLREGAEYPPQLGPVGGDLGYLKYGVFQGDDRTFSITLATNAPDIELRRLLLDEDTFTEAARSLPATSVHVDGRAEAITGVEAMGGLINRRREFTVDGVPLITGVHAIGDAHTATNPLYGRGCSLAMAQAKLLHQAIVEPDPLAAAVAYEAACRREILPWHSAAVAQDRMNMAASASEGTDAGSTSDDPRGHDATQAEFTRSILREGLFPAMREDPVVLRAFLRLLNLLEPPDSLMGNADVIGRVMTAYQARGSRPPELPLGPGREEMVSILAEAPTM